MNFEHLKALNPSALLCKLESTHHINAEDLQIRDFVISRTRDNLKCPIFILLLDNYTKSDQKLLQMLKEWINLKEGSIKLDCYSNFTIGDFTKNKLYVFNKFERSFPKNFDNIFISQKLIDNCGGMIFVVDNIKDLPKNIVSASHGIFINKKGEIREILGYCEPMLFYGVNLVKESEYTVLDRLKLWTNLSSLRL